MNNNWGRIIKMTVFVKQICARFFRILVCFFVSRLFLAFFSGKNCLWEVVGSNTAIFGVRTFLWTPTFNSICKRIIFDSCYIFLLCACLYLLKYGSEEKGSSFCKCSILLGFIMSKKLRGLWFYLLIKVQNATSLVFLIW